MKKIFIIFVLVLLVPSIIAECIDSENDLNPFVKGTVTYNSYETEDRCGPIWAKGEGLYVNELFCLEGKQDVQIINCLKGCKDGACLPEDFVFCEEKEGYIIDYFHDSEIIRDSCIDSKTLKKKICSNLTEKKGAYSTGVVHSSWVVVYSDELINCDKCVDGKCIKLNFFQKFIDWLKNLFS